MLTTDYDEGPLREQTMSTILENRATRFGSDPFVQYGPESRTISFRELDDTANSIANALGALGIETGDHVSVMVRDPLRTLFAMCGINTAGAVYSPINYDYSGEPLRYQLDDTDPSVLVVEDRYLERLAAIEDDLECSPRLVVYRSGEATVDEQPSIGPDDATDFADMLTADTAPPDVSLSWDDEASIVYTSGTTGRPKGVVLPYRWIFANYAGKRTAFLSPEDTMHTSLPLYHVAGLYWDVTAALIAGASVSLWDRFSATDFWDRIDRYDATTVTLLSVMIPWLDDRSPSAADRHNTLNKVHMQPLPENYGELAQRYGFDFITVGFGQTECGGPFGALVHAARGDDATPPEYRRGLDTQDVIDAAERVGLPVVSEVPGDRYMGKPRTEIMEATVLDENDEQLPPGEVGELAVRPQLPGLILDRYLGKPEETVRAFRNLWFHTGDAVYRDEADNFYFVDRIGDVIRRRGENISSVQIQDAINSHDDVAQAAVFPVSAPEGGEDQIGAAVVVENDLSRGTLEAFLDDQLPSFMTPDRLQLVADLPTTETNKIEKYKLRERFLED
ncbi:acyl-CoA synthetase [Salinadaptatus halalkaliphilus]|uniref:Acyl-CoA synthetase n=1 Tax=Salinadaptatus halalkaliphilus TaxID=2419781 RepID=A0A4S3TPT1_9EURY|nr:AMP-binding protein [Salinadaptatus halalkaliphilus]THE66331.1 acyl-CoA synthetase [Salinadaptatus halalkaliphilus]